MKKTLYYLSPFVSLPLATLLFTCAVDLLGKQYVELPIRSCSAPSPVSRRDSAPAAISSTGGLPCSFHWRFLF